MLWYRMVWFEIIGFWYFILLVELWLRTVLRLFPVLQSPVLQSPVLGLALGLGPSDLVEIRGGSLGLGLVGVVCCGSGR